MSTKVTLLYGWPEFDGDENDYHLYYDIADGKIHLRVKNKEIDLPPKLREELKEIFEIYEAVVNLVARMVAHAEHRGELELHRKIIKRIGDTSFNRVPYKKIYSEENNTEVNEE